jgi:hypothetical protein
MTNNELQPQSLIERLETIKLANELDDHVVKMLTHHIDMRLQTLACSARNSPPVSGV